MYGKHHADWFRVSMDAWLLGMEASTVVAMRMTRFATGDASAAAEGSLMMTEKVAAAFELQAKLVASSAGLTPLDGTRKTIRHYRSKVAANRRRLSR